MDVDDYFVGLLTLDGAEDGVEVKAQRFATLQDVADGWVCRRKKRSGRSG